jgi:cysteine desulfuration protein SufE
MSMPAPLAEVVSDFAEVQGQDKLALLLEFADDLPDLPPELDQAAMEPVPECQSPLFLHVDASDPSRVRLHFSAPAAKQEAQWLVTPARGSPGCSSPIAVRSPSG